MRKSIERIKQMVVKEFIQIFRDKRMKAIVFIVPVMQTLVFGYAVTTDVNNVPAAVYDLDQSSESRELIRRFSASGYFDINSTPIPLFKLQDALDRGTIILAFQISRGFIGTEKAWTCGHPVLVDGNDSTPPWLPWITSTGSSRNTEETCPAQPFPAA
jgi:ABC-2 type transport system permease protein